MEHFGDVISPVQFLVYFDSQVCVYIGVHPLEGKVVQMVCELQRFLVAGDPHHFTLGNVK